MSLSETRSSASSKASVQRRGSRNFDKNESRLSQRMQATMWSGIFSWINDCPNCPLLYFDADCKFPKPVQNLIDDTLTRSNTGDPERRKKSFKRAKYLISHHHTNDALKELLSLAKSVSYKVNEEECSLLIHAAEVVIRNQLQNARQVTHKDIGQAIGYVKANIRRVSLSSSMAIVSDKNVNSEKEELRNLLLTLVDVCQSLRTPVDNEITSDSSMVEIFERKRTESDLLRFKHRMEFYTALFGLLIQSAFLESGLVAGNVYINRLVSNAEETYYLTHESKEKELFFLRPLAAYIYGRLWSETGEDESHGAHFMTNYYEKHGSDFEKLLMSTKETESHSTYFCNMRRIRQFVHKQHSAM